MSRLPAHDIGDVHLADLMESPGCPVCRAGSTAMTRFLDAILWESVNDVGFRAELDAARGFCERHTRDVLVADRQQSGGALGAAILYRAILAARLVELEAATSAGRTRRRRIDRAAEPAACPVCRTGRQTQAGTIRRLQQLSSDETWSATMTAAEFCLRHFVELMRDAPNTPAWRQVEGCQLERLAALKGRLDAFIAHSGEDRRHLMTDDDRRAVDAARDLLGASE
jgi:uncharacterized protein DUF6062